MDVNDSKGDDPTIVGFTLFHAIPPFFVATLGASVGGLIGYLIDLHLCLHLMMIFAAGYFAVCILTLIFYRLRTGPHLPFWRTLKLVSEPYGCIATVGCILIAAVLLWSIIEQAKKELKEKEPAPTIATPTR